MTTTIHNLPKAYFSRLLRSVLEFDLIEEGDRILIGLSGGYDLRPLVATSLNVRLGLDAATARAASPVRRVGPRGCPALFVVGGGETAAFLDQSRRMAAA